GAEWRDRVRQKCKGAIAEVLSEYGAAVGCGEGTAGGNERLGYGDHAGAGPRAGVEDVERVGGRAAYRRAERRVEQRARRAVGRFGKAALHRPLRQDER